MLRAQANKEHPSYLIGIVVLRAACYAPIRKILVVIVCRIVFHAWVAIGLMISHHRHRGEVGREKFRLVDMNLLILLQRAGIHLVADIHNHLYVFGNVAIAFFHLSLRSLKEPFVSASRLDLVIAHQQDAHFLLAADNRRRAEAIGFRRASGSYFIAVGGVGLQVLEFHRVPVVVSTHFLGRSLGFLFQRLCADGVAHLRGLLAAGAPGNPH